jgi:putative SOS response-associated peptidase YedK
MCGRTTLATPALDLRQHFGLTEVPELPLRYNIAPTQPIAVIRQPGRLELLRWGLMLPDAPVRGPGINVRVETVARAPAYRDAFRQRRCLVIVDGFYEWERREKVRQPFAIRRTDGKPFALAGIWAPYVTSDGEVVDCCAIITGGATGVVAPLHDRMPLVVPHTAHAQWLAPTTRASELFDLMTPDATELETYPVRPLVNSPQNEGPICIERADAAATTLPLFPT